MKAGRPTSKGRSIVLDLMLNCTITDDGDF